MWRGNVDGNVGSSFVHDIDGVTSAEVAPHGSFGHYTIIRRTPEREKGRSLSVVVSGIESIYRQCNYDSKPVCRPRYVVRMICCKR